MANDREFSVILKATDLSTQPIQQVLDAVKKLTEAQQQNNQAAAQGAVTAKEFGDGLKTLLAGAQGLTGAQTGLQRFLDQQKLVAERLTAVAAAQDKLDAKRGEVASGAEPSDKQANAIQRLEKALASAQGRFDSANASLETLRTSLDKMGVAADLSDRRAAQLGNAREKALQAVLAAQEKLDAKIAASPADGERTKAQEYSIRRVADALTNAQAKAEQAGAALASYQNVKLNEAVIQAQVKLRTELEAITPVIQRANLETLSLTENRNKAAAATAAQAEVEKRAAAEVEAAAREAVAQRDAQNRQAIEAEDARVAALLGAASRAIKITEEERVAREKAYNEEQAAATRIAAARNQAAADEVKFRRDQKQAVYENLFTPVHEADIEAVKRQKVAEDDLAKARAKAALEQQDRLEKLRESQGKIADAISRTPGTQPLGVSAEPSAGFSGLSEQLQAILAPAEAARQTIGGVTKQIAELSAVLEGPKLRTEDYDNKLRSLGASLMALQRMGGLVDTYRAQEAATIRLSAALDKEKATREAMTTLYARTKVYDEQQVANINRQVALVAKLSTEFNRENESLAGLRKGLEAAGINFEFLDLEIQRIIQSAEKGKVAFEGLKGNSSSAGREFTFLGLRPYELQNLSYQINDVFTQLSSGTPITQVFAQQSGQIFQLFQRQLLDVLISLRQTPFALAALTTGFAVATLGVLAFVRALDQASERRASAAQLALSADGLLVNVDRLTEAAHAIEQLGLSYDEASKGARALNAAGINEQALTPLLKLAANLSTSQRIPLADAVKAVIQTFTGGYESFRRTELIFGAISAKTAETAKRFFEAGQADLARSAIFEEVSKKAQEAANQEKDAFDRLWIRLKNGWHDLLDSFQTPASVLSPFKQFAMDLLANFNETLGIVRLIAVATRSIAPIPVNRPQTGGAEVNSGGPSIPGTAGGTQAGQGSVGDRNNNPGNLEFRDQQGATRAGRWAQFVDLESGVAAALRQYLIYQEKYDLHTVQEMVNKATPPRSRGGDNPDEVVTKYIQAVAKELGVNIDQRIDLRDRNTAVRYVQAVARQEGNKVPPEAVAQGGVSRVLGPRPGETAPGIFGTTEQTEAQKKATEDFVKDIREGTAALKDSRLEGQAALDREDEILKKEGEKLRADADKRAQEYHASATDREQTERAIQERLEALRSQYAHERLLRERSVYDELQGLEEQQGKSDQTSLAKRLDAVDRQFQTIRNRINEQFQGLTGAQSVNGRTRDQVLADVSRLQDDARQRAVLETAQAITKDVVDQREKAVEAIKALNLSAKETSERITATLVQFGPKVREAVQKSNEILQQQIAAGKDSPSIQLELERNRTVLAQANRPQSAVSTLQTAGQQAESEVNSRIAQNKAQLDVITDSVKVGGAQASDAIARIVEFGKSSIAGLRDLVNTQRTQLEAIRDNPITSESDRQKIQTELDRNQLALSQAAIDVENAILAVLAEDQTKLDKLLEEYKRRMDLIARQVITGIISPLQAATQRANVNQELLPKIGQARERLVQDSRTAAATPGLSEGARQELSARAASAEDRGNTQTLSLESQQKTAEEGLRKIAAAQTALNEVKRTEAALLERGATTQTSAEERVKEATARANVELAKQAPTIQLAIDALRQMGPEGAAAADAMTEKLKLARAELTYIPPLTQQITQGFEQSFASRGEQAFDAIAKSIGTAIATGGKFKDVLRDTGKAFANMAAGILEDVAKIIIKYELLKLVKDALGDTSDTGTGNTSSSGTGSAASGVGGIAGLLAKLFGSSSGAGAAGAFDGAGVAAGTMVGEEAGFASLGFAVLHSGGTIGTPGGMSRPVDLSVFREAQRYHSGGPVLSADEVPIIAQRGEKVVSLAQQRQEKAAAAAAQGAGGSSIRNVLAVGDKEIAGAMNSSHGEKVVLNILQRNAPTVKKFVG